LLRVLDQQAEARGVSGRRILGLDVGTSGCKAVAFDERWNVAASSSRRYELIGVGADGYEMDAEEVWAKVREAIVETGARAGGRIDAVAVSALGDVIIPVDGSGTPVRHCILDFDPRGKDEIRDFLGSFGAEKLFHLTGMPPLHMNSLAKILWIRAHEPGVYRQVRRWATFEDFILSRLGAGSFVSWSMAARTMLFDLHRKTWSPEILAAAGLGEDALARPVPSGQVIGGICAGTARELGFADGAAVCSGGHDVVCAAVGAGLDTVDRRTALDIMGTFELVIVLMKEPNLSARMLRGMYPCYPAWNEYLSLSLNFTCGSVVDWCRDLLAGPAAAGRAGTGYEELFGGADTSRPCGLLLVPHFSGTCNPAFNPDARGSVYGLTLNTSRRDLGQAVLEGLCYDLRSHVEGLRGAGIAIERLAVVGGGTRSDAWLELKANITGMELVRSDVSEASALGAAALCATALGAVDTPYGVAGMSGTAARRFTPDPAAARRFEDAYRRYLSLRERVGSFETGKT
jgi:xylulokinase